MKLDAENQKGSERAKGFKNSIKPVKRAAVIHDLCGVGKAAMTNIVPILSVMGIEACPVPVSYTHLAYQSKQEKNTEK